MTTNLHAPVIEDHRGRTVANFVKCCTFVFLNYTPFRYKRDNLFHYFSLMKSLENAFYFFTYILTDFVTHESSKEF